MVNQEQIMQQLQAAVQAYQGKDLDGAELIFKQILAVKLKRAKCTTSSWLYL